MKEEWKDIIGYKGRYQVSNLGRVRSLVSNKILNHNLIRKKYGTYSRVALYSYGRGSDKRLSVHRLVAAAFIPNPHNKREVNHIDGNPQNNSVENLEWATGSENQQHSINVLGRNRYRFLCVETGEILLFNDIKQRFNIRSVSAILRATNPNYTSYGFHWKRSRI